MSKRTAEGAVFDVGAETLLELKAQVLKKQQEAISSRTRQRGEGSGGGVTKRPVAEKSKKRTLPAKQTMTLDEVDEWTRSREALERKARLYELLERGELDAAQVTGAKDTILVDFDRKGWDPETQRYADPTPKRDPEELSPFEQLAQKHAQKITEEEKVEYLDEFGRTRMVTLAEKTRLEAERDHATREEDSVYDHGTRGQDDVYDREAHPGPSHFDASWEIRTKGIGFFNFSRDELERQRQMQDLTTLRKSTVEERAKVEQQRRQMDALSGLIAERRRQGKHDP